MVHCWSFCVCFSICFSISWYFSRHWKICPFAELSLFCRVWVTDVSALLHMCDMSKNGFWEMRQHVFKSMMCDCTFLYFFAKFTPFFWKSGKLLSYWHVEGIFFFWFIAIKNSKMVFIYKNSRKKNLQKYQDQKHAGVGALEFWTKCTHVSAVCIAENWNVWLCMPVCGWKSVSTHSLLFLLAYPAFYLVPHFVCFHLFLIFEI